MRVRLKARLLRKAARIFGGGSQSPPSFEPATLVISENAMCADPRTSAGLVALLMNRERASARDHEGFSVAEFAEWDKVRAGIIDGRNVRRTKVENRLAALKAFGNVVRLHRNTFSLQH
jgi:hypothetical protein